MTLNQLDADSRKLRGVLESLGPCSSVLAALGTLQLQGPQLSTSRVVFLNQRLTYMYAEVWFGCFKAQEAGDAVYWDVGNPRGIQWCLSHS